MEISQIGSGTTSAAEIKKRGDDLDKMDFLKLLIAQLRHQDPLKPLADTEFIAQLAQFNSLEQMMNLNQSFEKAQKWQMLTQSTSLIGKSVAAIDTETGESIQGLVIKVDMTDEGPELDVDGKRVSYNEIVSIY